MKTLESKNSGHSSGGFPGRPVRVDNEFLGGAVVEIFVSGGRIVKGYQRGIHGLGDLDLFGNFVAFRALPTLPIVIGGILVIAGGVIITFWRPT